MSLPEYKILDPCVETLPHDELRRIQSARLVHMVHYVYVRAPFWRNKFQAAGLTPADIRGVMDLPLIPFCTKEELQQDQAAHPPFGSYACSHASTWTHFMTTSGTTGQPLRRVFSNRDWGYVLDRFQRRGSALGPGDKAVILGPTDGLMGPSMGAAALARQGVLVVHAGLMDTQAKLNLIADLRPQILVGTASYLLHLAEVAIRRGINLAGLGLKGLNSVGEPGAAIEPTRARLKELFGVSHVSDGYGITELFPLGGNCPFDASLHIADDMVVCEVVDPETGSPLPPGERGELVFTNLVGDTQPLLRYRSRDIGRISAPGERCRCGFTGTRVLGSIEGRVDDMIWYRGVNLFPSAIEAAVRSLADLSPEFQVVIEQEGNLLPVMTVRAEANADVPERRWPELAAALAEALRIRIAVQARVEILAFGTLPRVDARQKARRVVDRRRAQR